MRALLITLTIVFVVSLASTASVAAPGGKDTDGDGIPDNKDKCPKKAGPSSNGGCPISSPTTSGTSATLVGAGDIASGANQNDEATAKLLDGISGTVFTAGDDAYDSGSLSEFNNYYGPTWGRHKARTKPIPGNHEYTGGTTHQNGAGYFSYFSNFPNDSKGGSYSYDVGSWHVVALNTGQCLSATTPGPCAAGSAMLNWLAQDLKAHPNQCTLAYFHHPRFSSGSSHGNDKVRGQAIWDTLYANNADVVVSGHDHDYERFAPQSNTGAADAARGIREFVVGTGGRSLNSFQSTPQPNSQVRNNATYGVIKFTLKSGGYDWQFVPVTAGANTDSGSGTCH